MNDQQPECITDWICLPGAHLRFGECVEAPQVTCTCTDPDGPTICDWCRGRA